MAHAVFQNIYADIKQAIDKGDYEYLAFLPSEHELCELYDCSRMTIRRALGALAQEGYVQPQKGKGVRVIMDRNGQPPRGMDGLETFKEIAARRKFELVTKVTVFELITADAELAAITGFPEGSELTRIKRVRYADGKGVGIDDSYYLSSQVPGITPEIASDSIYRYLEQDLGMKIATGKRDITIEHPTRDDELYLDLGDFNALAVVRGQTYSADGIVMEYTETKQVPSFFAVHETVFRNARHA